MDIILNSLLSIPGCEKDEILGTSLLKLLRIVFFSEIGLHNENLSNFFNFLIKLYSSAKKPEYLTFIKAHLTSNLGFLFQKIKEKELPNTQNSIFKQPTFIINNSFDIFFKKSSNYESPLTLKHQNISQSNTKAFNSYKPMKKRENSMDYALMRTQNSIGSPMATAFSVGSFFNDSQSKIETFSLKKSEENIEWNEENKENNGNFEEELEELVKGNIRLLIDEVCLNLEGGGIRIGRIVPRKEDFQGKYMEKQDFNGVLNEIGKKTGKFGWFFI